MVIMNNYTFYVEEGRGKGDEKQYCIKYIINTVVIKFYVPPSA